MNQQQETVEINGVELREGITLWRYAALNTWEKSIGDYDPDEVLAETAEALAERYPDEVDNQPANVVQTNLKANPGIYDDTNLMKYHAMEVRSITSHRDELEITLMDWKEEREFTFVKGREEPYEGTYSTSEPLNVLEEHLGVTLLPVEDDNDE